MGNYRVAVEKRLSIKASASPATVVIYTRGVILHVRKNRHVGVIDSCTGSGIDFSLKGCRAIDVFNTVDTSLPVKRTSTADSERDRA